jgi:hypothetical protein
MTKLLEKRKVVELRKTGKSYSEIRKSIKVSKSSLSLWLRNVILTKKQLAGLKMKKVRAVERYKKSMMQKRNNRLDVYYQNQVKKWIPLTEREEFIAGLFLYWGEGSKQNFNNINITNTDPAVIRFSLHWMEKSLGIPKNQISIKLHLYKDMDIQKETRFWMKQLGVSKNQFNRPYIKDSLRGDLDQKGFGHGTCGLWSYKTEIKENILMAIKAISDNYSQVS